MIYYIYFILYIIRLHDVFLMWGIWFRIIHLLVSQIKHSKRLPFMAFLLYRSCFNSFNLELSFTFHNLLNMFSLTLHIYMNLSVEYIKKALQPVVTQNNVINSSCWDETITGANFWLNHTLYIRFIKCKDVEYCRWIETLTFIHFWVHLRRPLFGSTQPIILLHSWAEGYVVKCFLHERGRGWHTWTWKHQTEHTDSFYSRWLSLCEEVERVDWM